MDDCADPDLVEASTALIAVAGVAASLGFHRKDRDFGNLGGELASLSQLLEKAESALPTDRLERRVRKLLKDLARACSVREAGHLRSRITEANTCQ